MKKEPSGLVSALFRSCLLVSPFGYRSDVWVWCKPMSGAVYIWPSAIFLKLKVIRSLWLIPLGLTAPSFVLQSWFLSELCPGVCRQMSQVTPQDPPLPVPACWPAVNLRLVADLTILGRASGGNKGLWFLDLPRQVPFRIQGRWWLSPLSTEPLVWVCPGLSPCTWQGRTPFGVLEPSFGSGDVRMAFLWLSLKGRVPVCFPG